MEPSEGQTNFPVKLSVTEYEIVKGRKPYVLYRLRVEALEGTWVVSRRYREFRQLHLKLRTLSREILSMPFNINFPRKINFKPFDEKFLEARKLELSKYLARIITWPGIGESEDLVLFLDPKENPAAVTIRATKKGWLFKRKKGNYSFWERRFFVLDENRLYYYASESASEPNKVLDLSIASIEISSQKECEFVISLASKVYVLRAESSVEAEEWVIQARNSRIRSDVMNDHYLKFCESVTEKQRNDLKEIDIHPQLLKFASGSFEDNLYDSLKINKGSQTVKIRRPALSKDRGVKSFYNRKHRAIYNVVYDGNEDIQIDAPQMIISPKMIILDEHGKVKGATLRGLFDKLCDRDDLDADFIDTFLLTFDSFSNTSELLEQLIYRWVHQEDNSHTSRSRILMVLSKLLETHFSDFAIGGRLTNKLLYFIEHQLALDPMAKPYKSNFHELIKQKMGSKSRRLSVDESSLALAPMPILPSLFGKGTFDFLDLHTDEIARQLTLIQEKIFRSIDLRELLDQRWSKGTAPNIINSIHRFNKVAKWVSSYVVHVKQTKDRGVVISRFIDVAHACFQLNNFETAIQIISGLECSGISRLKNSWEGRLLDCLERSDDQISNHQSIFFSF